MNRSPQTFLAAAAILLAGSSAHAVTITQTPFAGLWNPVSPNDGTYVYGTSFVSPVTGYVTSLGTWLNTLTEDSDTVLQFQVLGSVGGDPASGPDTASVFATTSVGGFSGDLSFYSGAVGAGKSLTSGQTYWFSINAVDAPGIGEYQVGVAQDDLGDGGTFWYSNDPSGLNFDGRDLLPEMAFSATIVPNASVPDGGTTGLMLGSILLVLAAAKRKTFGLTKRSPSISSGPV